MLGQREPEIYGRDTLADIEAACVRHAATLDLTVDFRQSNDEGELVGWAQTAGRTHAGTIINAGAYTHTSIALLDALLTAGSPIVEVHLSNLFRREAFRHQSYVTRAATGLICGFGLPGLPVGARRHRPPCQPRLGRNFEIAHAAFRHRRR